MNKIKIILVIVPIIILMITGCRKGVKIEGNGNVITETRNSVSFNYVENSANFDVYIIPDTVFYVKIEAESNLIPHIRTIVSGNTLDVSTRENLSNNAPMKIYVHTPITNGVALSGSGIIDVGSFETDDFEAIISGSGNVYGDIVCNFFYSKISGSGIVDFNVETQNLKVNISGSGRTIFVGNGTKADYTISGSGDIESYGFVTDECFAKISGSGNIYTTTLEYIDVLISGSGNLFYKGNPEINSKITGSGQIIKQ